MFTLLKETLQYFILWLYQMFDKYFDDSFEHVFIAESLIVDLKRSQSSLLFVRNLFQNLKLRL